MGETVEGATTQSLMAMGFTETEALVYCELLRASPSTGYKLAQAIGKQPANTYQALKSLTQKGAVVINEADEDAKSYRPVPPGELLAALERAFADRRQAAEDALSKIYTPPVDSSVYQLKTVPQVLQRARSMIDGAQEVVLFDLFPGVYELVEESLNAARARGVKVFGITYDEAHHSPQTPYNGEAVAFMAERWPGLGLILVVDAREHLMSLLSREGDRVLSGMWSDSNFLACALHSSLAAEIRLTAMRADPSDPLKPISLLGSFPPGLRELLATA